MDRIFYEERQRLSPILAWVVAAVGLGMTFPLFRLLYFQVILEENMGINVKKIGIVLFFLMVTLAFLVWLTAAYKLDVKIDSSGIRYHYFPHHYHPKRIERQTIVGYEVREIQLSELIQMNKRLGTPDNKQVCTISGKTVVDITFAADQHIVLGTTNKDSIRWAMKKLLETS